LFFQLENGKGGELFGDGFRWPGWAASPRLPGGIASRGMRRPRGRELQLPPRSSQHQPEEQGEEHNSSEGKTRRAAVGVPGGTDLLTMFVMEGNTFCAHLLQR